MSEKTRLDHSIISQWVAPKSNVLDLGCGNGELLHLLVEQRQVHGTGVEIDEKEIYHCVERGVSVCHGDLDSSLADYSDNRFDYVILNESLQEVLRPEKTILEALRVGKKVIAGIPNFCHLSARIQVFFQGRVPMTKELPYEWYDTPNLRFLSIKDFRRFCLQKNIKVLKEKAITDKRQVYLARNVLAHMGLFLLER